MKILHTADWHLGNVFHGHSRTAEHRHFLNWLVETIRERQPDALLVAGDVFDTPNPSAEAEALLYDFLPRATEAAPGLQMVFIAGNHDSAARIEAPAKLLRRYNIYVRGTVHFTEKGEPDFDHFILPLAPRGKEEAECVVLALPYLRGTDYPAGMTQEQGLAYFFGEMNQHLRKSAFRSLPTVAVAHFYARGGDIAAGEHSERLVIGGQDMVDASVVGRAVSYTALGHLHRAQQVGGAPNAFYAGSALPMSFSERGYKHGVNWIDLDGEGEASVSQIPYQPLRELVSIPSGKAAIAAADLPAAIAALPQREKKDDGLSWPYLEIKVEERQPEPALMHEVMEQLAGKAVRFCRMVRTLPAASGTSRMEAASTPDTLQNTGPLRLARQYFRNRFEDEMPQALIDRFKAAEKRAAEEEC